jgi:transposase
MDMHAAYQEVGSYRGAAEICGTTDKTVKRVVEAAMRREALGGGGEAAVVHNYDPVSAIVAERVARTAGRITAKRLLPVAVAAGYAGSARNFRRAVAEAKVQWRRDHHRGRRPGVWAPGDMLVFDWGEIGPLFVFCAVLAWSRFRFVFFADNLRAETTMAALALCMETIGGVPKTLLTDRMGCLKAGTVAGLVIPTPDYVRFVTHYLLTELLTGKGQVKDPFRYPRFGSEALIDRSVDDHRAETFERSSCGRRASGRSSC